ncbi:MAG TPA: hypothetical protein DIC35_04865 [Candidatus Moranbacteria bacterium]|nr:hypothetical protein [Candidatus Moranbacteria bacterium]
MFIISLRHFPYDKPTGSLTPEGEIQGKEMATILLYLLAGKEKGKMRIVHAPATRCRESAEVSNFDLKVPVVLEECLNWDPRIIGDSNNDAVKAMIERYEAEGIETLILISHDGMVNRIAEWYIRGRGGHLSGRINLAPGYCCLVHEDGRYTLLPE